MRQWIAYCQSVTTRSPLPEVRSVVRLPLQLGALTWQCSGFLRVAAACKTHVWSSSTGFKGIIKKAVIFSVVCVGNGLDQVLGTGGTLRNAAIAAYCVNEAGSILENLGRLGYTGLIPAKIKSAIKAINENGEEGKK